MLAILLVLAVSVVAYANGANDNFKGVASLFGSRTCGYRAAIGWATGMTLAGSVSAIFLAQALLKTFSGKGLVPDALTASSGFLVATASFHGLPVSTTHVSVGSLLGMGIITRQARWKPVVSVIASWVVTLPCAAVLAALAEIALASFSH